MFSIEQAKRGEIVAAAHYARLGGSHRKTANNVSNQLTGQVINALNDKLVFRGRSKIAGRY